MKNKEETFMRNDEKKVIMKRNIIWVIAVIVACVVLVLVKCLINVNAEGRESVVSEVNTNTDATKEVKAEGKTPEISKVRNICELATVECYFNNVAKSVKEPGTGLSHIGEKERKFWIKYQVKVTVAYDVSQVDMTQEGDEISIYLPDPIVSSSVVESSWNKDSYVISKDRWLQKNPITAEDQTKAVGDSCSMIEEEVRNNTALISSAEQQARALIENYINQMGKINNTEYKIKWLTKDVVDESDKES